jgi:hypothetical protein
MAVGVMVVGVVHDGTLRRVIEMEAQ